jgi:hypothetical protein
MLQPAFGPAYAKGITQFDLGAFEIRLNPLIRLVLRLEKVRSRQIGRGSWGTPVLTAAAGDLENSMSSDVPAAL